MALQLTIESGLGLPRRFLNLIMDNRISGVSSLRCIDLDGHKFFNTKSQGEQQHATTLALKKKIPRIQLPSPSIEFLASTRDYDWYIHCWPLAGRQVLCLDQSGRNLLFNLDTKLAAALPDLLMPKWNPFCIFIPSANAESGGSIYFMERFPQRESVHRDELSYQFEAFVYHKSPLASFPS
jgi:hypothetical protein